MLRIVDVDFMKGLKEEVEGRGGRLGPRWMELLLDSEDMRAYLSVLSGLDGRGMCMRGALGIVGVIGVDDAADVEGEKHYC